MIASSSVQRKMTTWREPKASLPGKPVITLREIIKIKLRSSVVMESKQRAVKFAVKHEIRCHVALHSNTELTLCRVAQDNQKILVVTKIIFGFNSR